MTPSISIDLQSQIRLIALQYPDRLDSNGLRESRASRMHYYLTFPVLHHQAEAKRIADRNRKELFSQEFEQMVADCIDYIGHCTPIRSQRSMSSSYRWKHIVENAKGRYIINGAFIVTAIICKVKLIHQPQNLNCLVGLSTKGIRNFIND